MDRPAPKQPLPGDHFVEHDAEGPDVGALVHRRSLHLFGRHVTGCAKNGAGGGHLQAHRRVKW